MGQNIFLNVLFSQANVLPIINFERDYDSSQCINAVKQTLIVEEETRKIKEIKGYLVLKIYCYIASIEMWDKNARGRELYANPCS